MFSELSFELKAIGFIVLVSIGMSVVSIEMYAARNPGAQDTKALLYSAYDGLERHVDENIRRSDTLSKILR